MVVRLASIPISLPLSLAGTTFRRSNSGSINMQHHRRDLLKAGIASLLGMSQPAEFFRSAMGIEPAVRTEKLPVAAVVTVCNKNSHADVIVGKILDGYQQDGGPGPGLRLVSLYTDQLPENDLSRDLAKSHGFRIS